MENPLPSNASVFCSKMINCVEVLMYLESTSSSPIKVDIIKNAHKIMMHEEKHWGGKDSLLGEHRKSLAFAGYHIFAPVNVIEK